MSETLQRDAILEVDGLTMRFGGLLAVDGVGFAARRGDITALIGPNGAGKTTVFNCITGFYRPTSGTLRLHRGGSVAELQTLKDHNIARAGVARTFQNIRLFPGMTLLENLLVAQHVVLNAATGFGVLALLGLGAYRRAEAAAVARATAWLRATNLLERADDPAGSLPYGAQRRLEIARAMCTGPSLLCLDEPAAGLNPRESEELAALIRAIRDGTAAEGEAATSVLLIEHDMGIVMSISDHVIVLDHGRKIADGTPTEVRNDRHVIAAYLGEEEE
jgi:branched-chain amino acid transport system ATP-binding protein